MKKVIPPLLVTVLLAVICSAADAAAKPTLAVKTFDNKTDSKSMTPPAQAITDMMTTELFDAGIFNLVEREKLDAIATEIKLGQSGLMDQSTAPKVGKLKGARYQMTGAVTVYYYNVSGGAVVVPWLAGGGAGSKTAYVQTDLRVIDSSTGEIVYGGKAMGTAKREAAGLLTKFGGFGGVSYGGILASAAHDCVTKHVEKMKSVEWE